MTISEIIENLENESVNIEDMTQIPVEERNNILNLLEDVISNLGSCCDNYGEDPEDINTEDYEES